MTSAQAVKVEDVTVAYGEFVAVNDVSFDVRSGSIHALVGANGSGKSSLVKAIAGIQPARSGQLTIGGRSYDASDMTPVRATEAGLRFVHQQPGTFPDLTVAENLAIGRGFETGLGRRLKWSAQRRRAQTLLAQFHVDAEPDDLLGQLSPAKRTMIAIARALQDQGELEQCVLVLDEPTAALPANEAEFLLDALRRYAAMGQTILYISHRLDEITSLTDAVTVLRDGKCITTVDTVTLTHDDLVEHIVGRHLSAAAPTAPPAGTGRVLTVTGLGGGPVKQADLHIDEGEIVGIAGLVGAGRSSLMKMLFGALPMASGRVELDGRALQISHPAHAVSAGITLVPEDRPGEAAFQGLSVEENISIGSLQQVTQFGRLSRTAEERLAREAVRDYQVKTASIGSPIESLSGGNQQKVILARCLRNGPRVILLDEPSQGVDVGARAEIYEIVREATETGACALVVSSDFEELASLCHRVLLMRRGWLVGELIRPDSADEITASLMRLEQSERTPT